MVISKSLIEKFWDDIRETAKLIWFVIKLGLFVLPVLAHWLWFTVIWRQKKDEVPHQVIRQVGEPKSQES